MKAPGTKGRSSNFGKAMSRSAEHRQCPKCGRKSALVRFSDEWASGSYCRWDDCDYERVRVVGGRGLRKPPEPYTDDDHEGGFVQVG